MRFLFGRSKDDQAATAAATFHDRLLEQSRRPVFYTDLAVPDSFEGRFDLLVLHAALLLRRLRDLGPEGQAIAQALVDTLFARLDIAMRELGVSDIGVPKRMKRLAEAFKGRTAAYDDALAAPGDAALAAAIARNVLAGAGDGIVLARYARALDGRLCAATLEDLRHWEGILADPVVTVAMPQ